MEVVKTSSFQLPDAQTVNVVLVKLPGGRIVARTADQLVTRPTPPAPAK